MSDNLQANEPEARTPTGEIRDQSPTPTTPPPATATPTEAAPPEEEKSLLNQAVPGGAPEKYDFGDAVSPEVAAQVTDLFKGLNLSQDQAQKLLDFHVAQAQAIAKGANESATAIRTSWQAQVKADPEIGPRLPQVRQAISSALDTLGDPKLAQEFRAAMDFTGAGDHPAFVKAFYKLSQMITEPRRHVAGANPSPAGQRSPNAAPPSAAKALYPNLA